VLLPRQHAITHVLTSLPCTQPPKCRKCDNVMDAKKGCQVCPLLKKLSQDIAPPPPPVSQGVSLMLSKSKQGVKVARVTGEEEGKPVDIQVNDELIEVNGTKVEGMELEAILKLILKNKRVKVRLNRDGKDIQREFDR
jgi:hypothetical protein